MTEERPPGGLVVPDFEEMLKRFLADGYYGNQRYHLYEFQAGIQNFYARWLNNLPHEWINQLYKVIEKAEIPKGQVHRLAALGQRVGQRVQPVAKDMKERRRRYLRDLANVAWAVWTKTNSDELGGKVYLPARLVTPDDDTLTAMLKRINKLKRKVAPRTQRLANTPTDIKDFWK